MDKASLTTASRAARARKSLAYFALASIFALGTATAQVVGGEATGIDDSGSFAREMRACQTGMTQQDKATCELEAVNARADKQRGQLNNSGAQYDANAMTRCDAFKGEYLAACQARVMGYGGTSGSVAGGGVIREVETVVAPVGSDSVVIVPQTANPVVLVPNY